MKKLLSLLLALCLLFGLCSCAASPAAASKDGRLRIVCTIFPLYDWTKQILGERAADTDLTLLLDSGVDLHSFQPTAADIITISDCDLFVYVGGESDRWVADALKEARNRNMVVLDLMELLGDVVKEEEAVEGMEAEDEEEEEEGPEYDEHIWLSLRNAEIACRAIAEALRTLDPDAADVYAANADAYLRKLDELDGKYAAVVGEAPRKTLLFGDRFPFRYLTDDYGLDYYAAFVGCSAETEASFETVVFLADKVDELGLHTILQTESSDGSIAATIRRNTKTQDQQVLTLDSMQSVTAPEIEAGAAYLTIMTRNLEVLSDALQDRDSAPIPTEQGD